MPPFNPLLFLLALVVALCSACGGSSSATGTPNTATSSSVSSSSSSASDAMSSSSSSSSDTGGSSSSVASAGECTSPETLVINSASDDGSNDGHGPAKAIDGSLASDSRWSSEGDGKTLLLDLGTEATVAAVKTAWLSADERTAYYAVEASSDNSTWSTLVASGESQGTEDFAADVFANTNARYIRIIGHGNSSSLWNSLLEVQIQGCGGLDAPTTDNDGAPAATELDASKPPSENFDLSHWYVSVPVDNDNNGRADNIKEKELNNGYQLPGYFFTGDDGGMVFRVPPTGFRTSTNTHYPRTELREMLRAGNTDIDTQGVNANNWVFGSAPASDRAAAGGVDGKLRATLAVNRVSTGGKAYQIGRVIIGQIHANSDEPTRLYYRKLPGNSKGSLYFAHEINGGDDTWHELIGSRADNAANPADGIALDEVFSYQIAVTGNELTVSIYRDGKPTVSKTVDMSTSGYDKGGQYMYFKAGAYNQNNSAEESDYTQVTFYALEASH